MNKSEIMYSLDQKVCVFLNIKSTFFEELMHNFVIETKLSGHNNEIVIISFYTAQKIFLGKACLKWSSSHKNKLQIESIVIKILKSNNILCPNLIDVGLKEKGTSFILMEVINDEIASSCLIDVSIAESILDAILLHESILADNIELLQSYDKNLDLLKVIDFEKKITNYLRDFAPNLKTKDSFNFLNKYLNDFNTIKKSIVTDRSTENMFIGENSKITMIDFSTIRIGTQFDNWIQFVDDPRAKFSCSKEELIEIFFKKNNFQKSLINTYNVASIYTNLLQGIFTYKKDPGLSRHYINNANDAFERFNKKKGVLIDIGH